MGTVRLWRVRDCGEWAAAREVLDALEVLGVPYYVDATDDVWRIYWCQQHDYTAEVEVEALEADLAEIRDEVQP